MTDVLRLPDTTTTGPDTLDSVLLDVKEHAIPLFTRAVDFIETRIAELPELPEDLFELPLGKWALMAVLSLKEMPSLQTELENDTVIDITLRLWGIRRGMRVFSEAERCRILCQTEQGRAPKGFVEYYNL